MSITFVPGHSGKGLDVSLEDTVDIGHIFASGYGIHIQYDNFLLDSDQLRLIATKIDEMRIYKGHIPICDICGGTPYFPNVRPADKVFEEHVCSAPMHTNRPR